MLSRVQASFLYAVALCLVLVCWRGCEEHPVSPRSDLPTASSVASRLLEIAENTQHKLAVTQEEIETEVYAPRDGVIIEALERLASLELEANAEERHWVRLVHAGISRFGSVNHRDTAVVALEDLIESVGVENWEPVIAKFILGAIIVRDARITIEVRCNGNYDLMRSVADAPEPVIPRKSQQVRAVLATLGGDFSCEWSCMAHLAAGDLASTLSRLSRDAGDKAARTRWDQRTREHYEATIAECPGTRVAEQAAGGLMYLDIVERHAAGGGEP